MPGHEEVEAHLKKARDLETQLSQANLQQQQQELQLKELIAALEALKTENDELRRVQIERERFLQGLVDLGANKDKLMSPRPFQEEINTIRSKLQSIVRLEEVQNTSTDLRAQLEELQKTNTDLRAERDRFVEVLVDLDLGVDRDRLLSENDFEAEYMKILTGINDLKVVKNRLTKEIDALKGEAF